VETWGSLPLSNEPTPVPILSQINQIQEQIEFLITNSNIFPRLIVGFPSGLFREVD